MSKEINKDFDKEVKEWLKQHDTELPDYINEKVDHTLQELLKKKVSRKRAPNWAVACIVGTLIIATSMMTYASSIPAVKNILNTFKSRTYENYDEYASDLNITKQSKGVKVTINKVIYDGIQLSLMYTIEMESPMTYTPHFLETEIEINNKTINVGSSATGEFSEDRRTYTGLINYSLGREENIPEQFILDLKIHGIESTTANEIIKGKWQFEIPVSTQSTSDKVKEIDCDITLSDGEEDIIINKLITTPINTVIRGSGNLEFWDFIIIDDKGRYIEPKGGSASQDTFEYRFKEIDEDTKSLSFIPYTDIILKEYASREKGHTSREQENRSSQSSASTVTIGEAPSKIQVPLNLDGETKILSKTGEEYATITRVEIEENRTKIYYQSKHLVFGGPGYLVDNQTGEKILPTDDFDYMHLEDWRYLEESNECVVVFGKELTKEDYTVVFTDQSEAMDIHLDKTFKIDIN